MQPFTPAQRSLISARLGELTEELRDLARRMDALTAALPEPSQLRSSASSAA
jgi:hypothetical protein